MVKHLAILLATLALTGCRWGGASYEATIRAEDLLSDAARAEFHLPTKTALTLANRTDMEFVKTLAPDLVKAVEDFQKPTGNRVRISAARPIGKYLLLWVTFPDVADGGVDLIMSVDSKKVVGRFCGGYQG